MSPQEVYKLLNKQSNKYGAKKTVCSLGHTHDSKKEAERCLELHLLEQSGEITDLKMQVSYLIIPAIFKEIELEEVYKVGVNKGKPKKKKICEEQAAYYKADFVYYDKRKKHFVIEDCKGKRTKDYILKRKLMKQQYCNDTTMFIET